MKVGCFAMKFSCIQKNKNISLKNTFLVLVRCFVLIFAFTFIGINNNDNVVEGAYIASCPSNYVDLGEMPDLMKACSRDTTSNSQVRLYTEYNIVLTLHTGTFISGYVKDGTE